MSLATVTPAASPNVSSPVSFNVICQFVMFGNGAEDPPPASEIAALHAELLPRSPITKLGDYFARQYYTCLPGAGCIFGAVAYVNNAPAGFVAATADSNGFMKTALRRRWPHLASVVSRALISRPQRISAIWEAVNIMHGREISAGRGLEGEILSLGVRPDYRQPQFIRKTGVNIASELFQWVMHELGKHRIELVRAIVDADNFPAQMFYNTLNWELARERVPGWKIPSLEFVWRPKD